MDWQIKLSDVFKAWFKEQSESLQAEVLAHIKVLKLLGPQLARPRADTLNASKHKNMKELRVQHKGDPIRIAYAFDPERSAIVLCAGNKGGVNQKRFYEQLIKTADAIFDEHLETLGRH